MIKLYNTLSKKKEFFRPLKDKRVGFYSCGPTVYWYAHIGNLRTYIFNDLLKRVLEFNGYKVKHIMNLTDVGHLTSDADEGEDKMEKAAKKEKKTAWQIARFYTQAFKKNLKVLNIKEPNKWVKATDHIKEQIALIKILEEKGFAYRIKDGIYFDTSKIKNYGKLAGLKKESLKAGARVKITEGKKNITDFALWKFSPKEIKRQMEWDSPWGTGFPGWHTECVAMAKKYLDLPFDIHTGAIDLIPTHHTNEIAQVQAAFNKELANFWLHGEHLILKTGKMAKSEGSIILINDLIEKGINPLAFRYLCLQTHYRSKLNFSWKSLESAQNALNNFYEKIAEIKSDITLFRRSLQIYYEYQKKFLEYINDDLNIPKTLVLIWDLIKNKKMPSQEKYKLLLEFDKVLGLDLDKIKKIEIPAEIKKLTKKREEFRKEKKWREADRTRKEIEKLGFKIEDTGKGPIIKK